MYSLGHLLLIHVLTCLGQIVHGSVIIHGKKVPEHSMEYMVSVQGKQGHVCGGALISEDFVLTAAHCGDVILDHVLLGAHDLKSSNTRKINIKFICKNPFYVKITSGDDIMLLKLASKALLDNRVKTIPIPTSTVNLNDKQVCSVAGWGRTEHSGNSNVHDLREVNVSIINQEVCQEKWGSLPANIICAGGFGTNKGFCQGDSGGPLVCDGKAVGVVSFNKYYNCKYPDVPNVYTDVSTHFQWINRILEEQTCS